MEPVQGQLALDSVPYGYAYGVMLDTTIPVFHPQDLAVFFDYNIPKANHDANPNASFFGVHAWLVMTFNYLILWVRVKGQG